MKAWTISKYLKFVSINLGFWLSMKPQVGGVNDRSYLASVLCSF